MLMTPPVSLTVAVKPASPREKENEMDIVRHVVWAHDKSISHASPQVRSRANGRCRQSRGEKTEFRRRQRWEGMVKSMEELTEEEKRALRGSKFAPLPSQPPSSRAHPRLAHPGGPLKTNKAAALAKFLERKLQQGPDSLSSINPDVLELAVRNAKATVASSGTSGSGVTILHVDKFDDPEVSSDEGGEAKCSEPKNQKKNKKKMKQQKKKKKMKNKKQKIVEDSECGIGKKPKKKLKL